MAKEPLLKIRISGIKPHYKALIQHLHTIGILEITPNEAFIQQSICDEECLFDIFDIARIDFAIRFLSPFQKTPKLESLLVGEKIILTSEEAKDRFRAFSPFVPDIISECEKISELTTRESNELQKILQWRELLDPYKLMRTPLYENFQTEHTQSFLGSLSSKEEKKFLHALSQISHLVDAQIITKKNGRTYFRVTSVFSLMKDLRSLFESFTFVLEDFSCLSDFFEKRVRDILKELEKKTKAIETNLSLLQKRQVDLAQQHLNDLKIVYDYHSWWQVKHELQRKILKTEHVFALEGWLIAREYETLSLWIQTEFGNDVFLGKASLSDTDVPPTLFRNNALTAPFSSITSMFGIPSQNDIDPTPFLAPFFFIFFGLCLSDTGYGILLSLFTGSMLLFAKLSRPMKNSVMLLFLGGLSTILGGIVSGGYFGMTPDMLPFFLNFLLTPEYLAGQAGVLPFRGQLFDPLSPSGPITFLILSIALGGLHLLVGLIADFVKKVCAKNFVGAFGDSVAWIFFLLALTGFGLADTLGLEKQLFTTLSLVGAGILVLTQSRHQKNWFLKPISGVLSLYGLTGYLSDLLSYARLMALGLSTGVIGFAMNLTAGVLFKMMPHPILGFLVATIILLFGHSLNFALSTLGAFVHSGRLQFIEFFSKFFEGSGREFQPFVRKKKYLFFSSRSS